jgi:hypothetical protein
MWVANARRMRGIPTVRTPARRIACAAVIAANALALGGCIHTRQVTPWLRTTREVPFRLMAESGHSDDGDKVRVDRREGRRWGRLDLPSTDDRAFGLGGGTRAVVGDWLVRPKGAAVRIRCGGELRATPDGSEMVCVETFALHDYKKDEAPQTLRITRLDTDGRELERLRVPFPVKVPDDEPPLAAYVSVDFLGFLPEGLVFVALKITPEESFGAEAVKVPRAFLLPPDGRFRELGSMRITVGELWALHFPRLWNERLGWRVDLGRIRRDSAGSPNP